MPELSDGQFQGLKPGFLSTMPRFRSEVMEKMAVNAPALPNIPDAAMLSMYKTGVYSHPGFGDMPEADRAFAVRQALRGRRVLSEFSEKEAARDTALRGPARAQAELPKPDWIVD